MTTKYAALTLLAAFAAPAALGQTAQPFRIIVNNQTLDTRANPPVVVRGSLLVPLAAIGTALGAYMEWRPESRSVYGRQNLNEFMLPVNSALAMVNGRQQTLDTPASIIGGRTMVPLRFVATALGAEVRFEGPTKTVYVQTAGQDAPATPAPGIPAGEAGIERFYVQPARPVKGGETITVTLEGTPGQKAEFDYGPQKRVAMREVTAGRYTASVTVPANAPFGRYVAVGRIGTGASAREVQAGDRIVIDTQPPSVSEQRPRNGARVDSNLPYISAEFDDNGQSGVDRETVKLLVNGEDVTSQANVSSGSVVYRGSLQPGESIVRLQLADVAGNQTASEWRFTVTGQEAGDTPAAPTISVPAADEALSGDIRVSGTAEPNATVRVRTTYTGTVLLVLSQEDEVNTQEVRAGADGKWQTDPFTLPAPNGVRNIRYTVTATATNSKGLTSEPTQVTFRRR